MNRSQKPAPQIGGSANRAARAAQTILLATISAG